MKRLLGLILLGGLLYFGYLYYQRSRLMADSLPVEIPPQINLTQGQSKFSQVSSVLGTSISQAITAGTDFLSDVTDGQSDPIINRALKNIQNEVKDLPQEAVDKVKYEFCKDVVTDYENR